MVPILGRAFLDTNVLVAAALTPGVCRIIRTEAYQGKFRAVVSPKVLEEFQLALDRLRTPAETVREALNLVRQVCETSDARPAPAPEGLSESDRRLVGEAIAAGAEFFVTGDRGIQAHAARIPITVITPRAFLGLLTDR